MLYPVYVHKEPDSAYGAAVPDMPGVFSAADELVNLPAMVQEAVEAMFDGEDTLPPPASDIERWQHDPDYSGGFWMLIDVDLSKVNTRAVRLNISLPENLLQKIDGAAKARRMSRSAFLALAAEREIATAKQ